MFENIKTGDQRKLLSRYFCKPIGQISGAYNTV